MSGHHFAGVMGSIVQRSFSSLAPSNPCLAGLAQGWHRELSCQFSVEAVEGLGSLGKPFEVSSSLPEVLWWISSTSSFRARGAGLQLNQVVSAF